MIGHTIGHYRIVERLGEGGMGVIYRAEDTKLGRIVALKFLPAELSRDAEAKIRFEREARAASLLDHPNICTIYDFGEAEGGQMYIAMAYYDGESLAARIARDVLSLDEAIRIVEQVARGLGKAHASGIVHRDIKPANVMITSDGIAKILDFGLAKLSSATVITRSHTSLGTIVYMAPEQIRGEEVGAQADLWALGVVLFELLTGKRPFRGEYTEAIQYAILNETPATITDLRPDLPPELDPILKRMLRKDPLQRYQTVSEVLSDLEPLKTPSSGSGAPRRATKRQKLRSGAKLGPYQIEKPLGSGGMGDVYLARDTRLERQVAIKVLPPEFSEDAQLKERFQREAKTISQLSHSNICTLFDVGEQEGVDFLVMEYLEGETLADRKGPLPIAQVLKIGTQIAEGLAAAHGQGIVHRDLKPGNVMITKAGVVKLVDFGLAKEVGAIAMKTRGSDEKPLTAEGMIVGTLAYMAPEQIERGEADARTDIFALGAILYEMVTGKRAFEGETKASLIANIIERDPPPIHSLQPVVPSTLERIIRRCLEKDREKRWQSAADLAAAIALIGDEQPIGARPGFSRNALWSAWAAALLIAAAAAAVLLLRPGKPAIGARYNLDHPGGVRLVLPGYAFHTLAISNDGRWVAFTAFSGVSAGAPPEERALYVRAIDRVDAHRVVKGGGLNPFFSPDGKWLGFHGGDTISKVPVSGGEPVQICRAPRLRGASWGEDGMIVYSAGEGLLQVSANGGEPKVLTTPPPGERHRWPQHLPDGRTILFMVHSGLNETANRIAVLSLDTGLIDVVLTGGSYPRYEARSGNLIYGRLGTLYAAPFDLRKFEISGEPRAVLDDVSFYAGSASVKFALSNSGAAVYISGAPRVRQGELVSIDRQGEITSLSEKRRGYETPVPSPDGRSLAVTVWTTIENKDVWILDNLRDSWTRLTRDGTSWAALWSPDGRWLVYSSHASGKDKLFRVRSDGSGQPEPLTTGTEWDYAWSFSPDGKRIAFERQVAPSQWDIFTIPVEGDRAPQPFLATPDSEGFPAFSPDGRWIAYHSFASGRMEIYVRPYPGPGAAVKVSTEGGGYPFWNTNERELFYVAGRERDEVWVASVTTAPDFSAGTPRRLFKLDSVECCSVSSDGQQFFGVRYPKEDDQEHHLVYIPNFSEELRQGIAARQ